MCVCVHVCACVRACVRVQYHELVAPLVDGDDELGYVGDELVALGLPEGLHAGLQVLHQHLLEREHHPVGYTAGGPPAELCYDAKGLLARSRHRLR